MSESPTSAPVGEATVSSNPEWARAFELAASVRQAGIELVEAVGDGRVDLAEAHRIADSNELVGHVFAVKVYEAVPGIGKVKARRSMAAIGLGDDVMLADVDGPSRDQIAERFESLTTEPKERSFPPTVVVSGPGGAGKGTVVDVLLDAVDHLWLSRSWTTREPRVGEAPDAYRFVTRQEFMAHVEAGGFLEWVEFIDYLQGTPMPTPPPGSVVILEIDIKGAEQIKRINPAAHLVFIDTPSVQEQRRRLVGRGDSEERVALRLEKAVEERHAAAALDCEVVINDELDATVAALAAIVERVRRAA